MKNVAISIASLILLHEKIYRLVVLCDMISHSMVQTTKKDFYFRNCMFSRSYRRISDFSLYRYIYRDLDKAPVKRLFDCLQKLSIQDKR